MDKKNYVTVRLRIMVLSHNTDMLTASIVGEDKFKSDGWTPAEDGFVKGNS